MHQASAGIFILLLFFALSLFPGTVTADPCNELGAALLVDTDNHWMRMCQDGNTVAEFPVSIGRGGVDKHVKGDRKTPLGRYDLGAPRTSQRFCMFIPIAFPNEEQKMKGFSGADIGVHGPHRKHLWLGSRSTLADWTYGCIAVGTDADIALLAQWVRDQNVRTIVIR